MKMPFLRKVINKIATVRIKPPKGQQQASPSKDYISKSCDDIDICIDDNFHLSKSLPQKASVHEPPALLHQDQPAQSLPVDIEATVMKPEIALTVSLSVRFDMIDAYVRVENVNSSQLPSHRYDIKYRKLGESTWQECWRRSIVRVSGATGRLCTISNLQPSATYQVLAELVSTEDEAKLAATCALYADTKKPKTFVKGYQIISHWCLSNDNFELPLLPGEMLSEDEVIKEERKDRLGFIYLRHIASDKVGYLPKEAVERCRSIDNPARVQDQEYFFEINRRKAMVWLMRPNVELGCFLLRPSNDKSHLSLSVRCGLDVEGFPIVHHYKIFMLTDGYGCYISVPFKTFEDIEQLVKYYKARPLNTSSGHKLASPFPRNPRPSRLDEVLIPSSQLVFIQKLGQGHFGEVHRAQLNGFDVAVKQLLPNGHTVNTSIIREAEAMTVLFHENLVRLIGVCIDTVPIMVVTEFMNSGNLLKHLSNTNVVAEIVLQDVVFILGQMACGMAYLEEQNIVHRDVRAENILVNDDSGLLEIKISDFGLARILSIDQQTYIPSSDMPLPIRWAAPEVIKALNFSVKSDVWSFGILAYEVFTLGALPYKGKSNQEVFLLVGGGGHPSYEDCLQNKRRLDIERTRPEEDLCPEPLFKEIQRCWHADPQSRPTFAWLNNLLDCYELNSDYLEC